MDKSLILREIKEHLNIRFDKDFADYLGVKTTTLAMWHKRNAYDIELLFNKCEFLSPEWLLTGKGEMLKTTTDKVEQPEAMAKKTLPLLKSRAGRKSIPLLPLDAFAGFGESSVPGVNFDAIEERYDVPLFYNVQVDFMINVRGSSMYPKYSSGDVVACRMINELLFVQWNKIYVIDTISQGIMMKRLIKSKNEGKVVCKSDNPDYIEFEVPFSDIRKIAIVVGSIRLE